MFRLLSCFLLVLINCLNASSQSPFLIEEEFDAAPSAPPGYTFSGSISSYTNVVYSGKSAPALKFTANGDCVTTTTWSNGDQISFLMRCPSVPNSGEYMQVEVYNGSAWSTLANVVPHSTATVTTLSISTSVTRARFTYSYNGTNVSLDDFTVRKSGSCAGSSFTSISFINVDACGSSCEGEDEFFTFKTGGDSLSLSNLEFSYPDGGTYNNTWCGTGSGPCDNYLATNTGEVSSLNSLAGCSIFLNPGAKIPPYSNILVFNGNPQNTRTDFSSLCSSGVKYYAVFANNTSGCNGHFGNYTSGASDPYRGFFIRDRSTGCTDTNYYSIDNSGLNNGNGSSVSFTTGSPVYVNTSCSFLVLPVSLMYFSASLKKGDINLSWSTSSEINSDYFTVERSFDGRTFQSIADIKASGNSSSLKNYLYVDKAGFVQNNIIYYRLSQTDFDGAFTYSRVVAVDLNKDNKEPLMLFPNPSHDLVYISLSAIFDSRNSNVRISIFSIDGRKIIESLMEYTPGIPVLFNLNELPQGMYLIRVADDGNSIWASLVKD